MNMKTIVVVVGVLIILAGGFLFFAGNNQVDNELLSDLENKNNLTEKDELASVTKQVVSPGLYSIDLSSSIVNWAGKKPLIDGYINSGVIGFSAGTITVTENEATGEFTIDMNTLNVGSTAKKPGQESTLEGHLKGEGWFDVAKFPTASFNITNVSVRTDSDSTSDSTFQYDVTGDLTMKGVTNEINFPAEIYETASGQVQVEATTTIDRTKWGLTAMSGSFFDNLADNVIDDSVQLSFTLVADKN